LPRFLLLCALVAALGAASARADGDPASDYLISQPVFLPFEQKVDDARAAELTALLADAKKKGFEVRVALIATRTDLGAVPVLFGKPQRYAQFLGQELVYFYKRELLVVMPNGYGLYQKGAKLTEDKAALAAVPPPEAPDGNALAAAAGDAVRALAKRRGLTLAAAEPADGGGSSGSSGNRDRIVIVVGVLVLAAIAIAVQQLLRRRRRPSDAP
jgi:hypothetical protein